MILRPFTTAAALLVLCSFTARVFGATIAYDDASDAAYDDGWQATDNGGTGFLPWAQTTFNNNPSTGGFFVGNSSNNGSIPSGDINSAGESWGLYANSNDVAYAGRFFSGGPLTVGQTFTIDVDTGFIQSGASVGFVLGASASPFDVPNPPALRFFFAGGTSFYQVVDEQFAIDNTTQNTMEPLTDDGLTVSVTLTSPNTYALAINGVPNSTGTLRGANPLLSSVVIYNGNAGSDASANAFFNTMSITDPVPEPATLVLAGLAVLGLVGIARRRK